MLRGYVLLMRDMAAVQAFECTARRGGRPLHNAGQSNVYQAG